MTPEEIKSAAEYQGNDPATLDKRLKIAALHRARQTLMGLNGQEAQAVATSGAEVVITDLFRRYIANEASARENGLEDEADIWAAARFHLMSYAKTEFGVTIEGIKAARGIGGRDE